MGSSTSQQMLQRVYNDPRMSEDERDSLINKCFQQYDQNRSGELDRKTGLRFLGDLYDIVDMATIQTTIPKAEMVERWFSQFDQNGDNSIQLEEFQRAVTASFTIPKDTAATPIVAPASSSTAVLAKTSPSSNTITRGRAKSTDCQEPVPDREWDGIENCGLCLGEFEQGESVIRLTECKGHFFHKDCEMGMTIGQYIEEKKKCPVCGHFYGNTLGDMPTNGQMTTSTHSEDLPGYPGCGHISIQFTFPGGVQGPRNYQPNQPYSRDSRKAYLPNNPAGQQVLRLFQQAWTQRVLFTIGYSITRKRHGVIIYNGIHMKTNKTGGTSRHGYPDATYLERVTDELSTKGIVPQ